ncbi:MAG: hypothetical protein GTO17_08535 [Candidatus Aminicenantes bacterium]|nr:hypothetical protein [Candidatus Aminicenantes bacterium]
MHFKKFLSLSLVFLWIGICLVTRGQEVEVKQAAKKIADDAAGKNLIRKDLLFEKEERLRRPRRNIFSPQAVSKIQAESPPEDAETSQKLPSLSSEGSVGGSEGIKPDLRYLGYVKSGQKITALVFFEGEALVVVEDEMIRVGIRIGKVTSEEIELIGADSQKWKYSLEGEEE